MNEYFDEGALPADKIAAGLKRAVAAGEIIPLLCGSALHNIAIDRLLDFLKSAAPSPVDRGEIATEDGALKVDDGGPLALFVWKTAADAFAGRVTYFKVVSGVLQNDAAVYNHTRSTGEKFSRIGVAQGKELTNAARFHAGDIGVVAKLKETLTGDSLGAKGHAGDVPQGEYPGPGDLVRHSAQNPARRGPSQQRDRQGSRRRPRA